MKWLVLLVLTLAVGGGVGWWYFDQPTLNLPAGVTQEDYEAAMRRYEQRYHRTPDRLAVLSAIGEEEANQEEKDWAKIAACFEELTASPRYAHAAHYFCGEAYLRLQYAGKAEKHLRRFLELNEQQKKSTQQWIDHVRSQLRHLLEIQLRFEERKKLLEPVVLGNRADAIETNCYCFPSLLRWHGPEAIDWCEKYLANEPEHYYLRVAMAKYRASEANHAEAAAIIATCREEKPHDRFALGTAAWIERDRNDWDAVAKLLADLDKPTKDDPWTLLLVRGDLAIRNRQFDLAERCFKLLLENDPCSSQAYSHLALLYRDRNAKGDDELFRQCTEKSQQLRRIQNLLGWGQSSKTPLEPFFDMLKICETGGFWDAGYLMARFIARFERDGTTAIDAIARLREKASDKVKQ